MTSAVLLLLSLAFASPRPTPSAAAVRRAAELRRGWADLDVRARAFLRAPAVASSLRGGGVAVDRAALFSAADRALAGGHGGYSLTLLDPNGDPAAGAGRAPTFFPTGDPSGAIRSAESVVFFRTLAISFAGAPAGKLVEAWRLSREANGARLAPEGALAWNSAGAAPWGGVDSAPVDRAARRRGIARSALVAGAVVLLVLSIVLPPAGPVRSAVRSAIALGWGTAGAASLVSATLKLEPGDYAREPAVVVGFALSAAAAALFSRKAGRGASFAFPAALAIAGFVAGTLLPTPIGIAAAFGAALA
ncbi:MAG TPA: hypothetical protein VG777_00810, partial [Thermoanaerobaculia bacterium]|nr:hypothetical protein [Thermoanaerobaculia bacterium]